MSLVSTLVETKGKNQLLNLNSKECEVIVFGLGVGESILVHHTKVIYGSQLIPVLIPSQKHLYV